MATAPHLATPSNQPVPPVPGAAPSPSFRLLTVVHALIEFGRRLTHALGSHPAPNVLHAVTRTFGTRDLALIMARIMRALRLAEALRQRVVRTATQIDNPRFRLSIPRPKTERPKPQPDAAKEDLLARLPTVEELAEQIRRRPIGAVLVDICRDLGIDMANPVWSPLYPAIAAHRGNLFRLLSESSARPRLAFPPEITAPAPATGPPTPA